ncbi:hypothetical protein BHE74_00051756 [Ensete ventricosum]|nr:hypothetical protein BHE74_00051756 [Ensete ventricosum]
MSYPQGARQRPIASSWASVIDLIIVKEERISLSRAAYSTSTFVRRGGELSMS